MSAERRNATVVITLVISMTCGTAVLLWLEQALSMRPSWRGSPLLAMQPGSERRVEISFEAVADPYAARWKQPGQAGCACLVLPDGSHVSYRYDQQPLVRVVVVGSLAGSGHPAADSSLTHAQKLKLLEVLGSLTETGRADSVTVAISGALGQRELPPQAVDLMEFLRSKQLITAQ